MSKAFKLLDRELPAPSTSSRYLVVTNWKLCVICQEEKDKQLTCPSKSKRKDVGSGYSSLAEKLIEFNALGQLPFNLERLDDGEGIEITMVTNNAQYHQSCRLRYNNTMLKRAEKRALKLEEEELEVIPPCKRSRSRSADPSTFKSMCFFFVKSLQVGLVSMKQLHFR